MKYVLGIFLFLAALAAVVLIACKYVNLEQVPDPQPSVKITRCEKCNKEINAGRSVCDDCVQKEDDEIAKQKEYIDLTARRLVKKFKKQTCDKNYFNEINKICSGIISQKDKQIIKGSKIYKFAEEYLDWYDSNLIIKITSIKIKKDPSASDTVQFNSCFLHLVNSKGEEYSSERREFYREAKNEEIDLLVMAYKTIKPWDTPYLTIHWSRYNFINTVYDNKRISFNPHTQKEFECDLHGFEYVKVTCSVESGETFSALLKRVFGTATPDLDAVLDKEKK